MLMVFIIFAEGADLSAFVYTVTINASYSEIEAASKCENFISWVVENATNIEVDTQSDFYNSDFGEHILSEGDQKLALYYVATEKDIELLPKWVDEGY